MKVTSVTSSKEEVGPEVCALSAWTRSMSR